MEEGSPEGCWGLETRHPGVGLRDLGGMRRQDSTFCPPGVIGLILGSSGLYCWGVLQPLLARLRRWRLDIFFVGHGRTGQVTRTKRGAFSTGLRPSDQGLMFRGQV